MEKKKLITTQDNSHTLYNPEIKEHYHSTFGAIQESEHVFIKSGLEAVGSGLNSINILEIGFGTGLNALLTFLWAEKHQKKICYFGLEAFPVSTDLVRQLNYPEKLEISKKVFLKLHQAGEEEMNVSEYFQLRKKISLIEDFELPLNYFDLVYFDAFSPDVQPGLWTVDVFRKIAKASKVGAILTTYSCKGVVKRALQTAGFEIEKLPGPPGKREILRAVFLFR